ncbi:MAG: SDR family NAD(P)-dependent oxidoreductase [Bacteriovoracaceae bacterium]|nr:SDR family NAD(P)-dependent oxidoreductase [Bacteriovoracaceae bacterium]
MKSYFITGGTTGIGWELAKLFLKEGHRVAVCGRVLEKLPKTAKEEYPLLHSYELSVTDEVATEKAIQDFAKGGLDVVVANAGISHGSKSRWPDKEVSKSIVNTNLLGVINTFFPAMEIFKEQGSGHLVAIASIAGYVGLPGASAYSASKGALIHLCESYALDLPNWGIDVTTICPGFIDTPLTKKNDHSMPFLMSCELGALKIKKAIDKKKVLYIFPWQMALVMHILRRLPRSIYRKLMKMPMADYSKK